MTLTYSEFPVAQQWKDIRLLALQAEGWVVLFGRKALTVSLRIRRSAYVILTGRYRILYV